MENEREALIRAVDVRETEEEMGRAAARLMMDTLREAIGRKGKAVALFASAPSQHSTWRALIELWREMPAERQCALGAGIIAFHMDEYLGLPEGAPQSFGRVLGERLFPHLRIPAENVRYFDSAAAIDPAAEAARVRGLFEQAGGHFDVVLGGIGKLPHVAFNDPPSRFDEPETIRVVRLEEESRIQQVADGEFARVEDVPTHALTFSLPPIFAADRILIVVPRALKADSVFQTLEGPVTEMAPASGLRLPGVLPRVRFFLDRDAAAKSPLALEAMERTRSAA